MAGETGLEPAASNVTGWRYNQLNYSPAFGRIVIIEQNALVNSIKKNIYKHYCSES